MNLRLTMNLVTIGLVMLLLAPAAHAQATRTWVSGVGDDANPCSRTAPCKTFAGAISKTATGGEISVLDPGGFGAVTITKSITINGDGTLAAILAAGTNGIVVNALATDKVIIRNISINGANSGLNGIRYLAGGALTVENVTISGFNTAGTGRGISVETAAAAELLVTDTTITNCLAGIRLASTAGNAAATIDNVRIENVDGHAFEAAQGNIFGMIRRSTFASNTADGVRAGIGTSTIMVEDSVLAFNNGTAVNAAVAPARIRISNSTIVNNNRGIGIIAGAFVESADNNRVAGNVANTLPNAIYVVQ
ncbi:MAG: hypothetical protein HOP18_02580 [Deltaproteobacteria bacterium]|nr:hypothetical protein [Deltaproteobacteria bacterium]